MTAKRNYGPPLEHEPRRRQEFRTLLRDVCAVPDGELSDERLRDLLIATMGAYAERVEQRDYGLELDADVYDLDRSEVLLVVSRLLEAADLELFEVAMWRMWARS